MKSSFAYFHRFFACTISNIMAYQSSEAKKEEFRKYLEKSSVIDALTKALVCLYEEPDRPENPVEYIRKVLGGPSKDDFERQKAENERLQQEVDQLRKRLGESGAA
jgi:hypothetical protein